jgi:hypothetical protein
LHAELLCHSLPPNDDYDTNDNNTNEAPSNKPNKKPILGTAAKEDVDIWRIFLINQKISPSLKLSSEI